GRVLVVGGASGSSVISGSSTAQTLDPTSGNWANVATPATPRQGHTARLQANSGEVMIVGGTGSSGSALNTVELWTPPVASSPASAGTWATTAPLSTARSGHTLTQLANSKLVAVGGTTGSGVLSSAEVFDADSEYPAISAYHQAGTCRVGLIPS